jgi:hypothetical protein
VIVSWIYRVALGARHLLERYRTCEDAAGVAKAQEEVLAELEEAYVDARRAPGTGDSYSNARNHLFSIVQRIMKMMTYWSRTQITDHHRTLIPSQGRSRRARQRRRR